MSMYEELSVRGFEFEPAPRANPGAKLNEPYVLRRVKDNKIVMRGYSRDDLEEKAQRLLDQMLNVETFDPDAVTWTKRVRVPRVRVPVEPVQSDRYEVSLAQLVAGTYTVRAKSEREAISLAGDRLLEALQKAGFDTLNEGDRYAYPEVRKVAP